MPQNLVLVKCIKKLINLFLIEKNAGGNVLELREEFQILFKQVVFIKIKII